MLVWIDNYCTDHPVDNVYRASAALVDEFEKRFVDVVVPEETAINQRYLVADQLRQIRVQSKAALLGMEENAHQPARLVAKDTAGNRVNLAFHDPEPVHQPLARAPAARPEEVPE